MNYIVLTKDGWYRIHIQYQLSSPCIRKPYGFGKDYFDELLERIKEICVSERRFYQEITDI